MTTPSRHYFLLFAYLLISESVKHKGHFTAVASKFLDNEATEDVRLDLPNSEPDIASSPLPREPSRISSPFTTLAQPFSHESNRAAKDNSGAQLDVVRLNRHLEEVETWPWDKNSTSSPTITPADDSCFARLSCEECNSMSCHWCSFDDKCHAKGSPYGCAIGSNCKPKNDTKPDNDDDNDDDDPTDNSCRSHLSCTECVLSSNLCHWCAFDDRCHAIGSWYGCTHGTDCYANDRCQRPYPDPIKTSLLSDIGFAPIFFIASIGLCALFCSSVVYGGVRALKGAYEDLAHVTAPSHAHYLPGVNVDGDHTVGLPVQCEDDGNVDVDVDVDVDVEKISGQKDVGGNVDMGKVSGDTDHIIDNTMTESLLDDNYVPPVTAHPDPSRIPRGRIGSQNINCFVKVCNAWYIFTVIGTILTVALSFYCFPRMPQYNLCSDEVAWKSIIDGITSLKMEASFELLISIENKNHLGIILEEFSGKLYHDGGEVGAFTLPQSTIASSSITDVLVTVTVVPNKWEALGLIAEYYKGTLVLSMSVNGAVKLTAINYSFPVKKTDVVVRVNDPSNDDRHLCACPEWSDLNPTIAPVSDFPINQGHESSMTRF